MIAVRRAPLPKRCKGRKIANLMLKSQATSLKSQVCVYSAESSNIPAAKRRQQGSRYSGGDHRILGRLTILGERTGLESIKLVKTKLSTSVVAN